MKKQSTHALENSFILTPFFLDTYESKLEKLLAPGWVLNKPALPDRDKQTRMSTIHLPLAALVMEAIAKGLRPVSIAGDCCTAIGVLAGLQRTGMNPTLIWFDAHGDFNDWDTTPSGFLGGMPLAMLVGIGEQTMVRAVGLKNIPEDKVILTDGRDLDPGEQLLLKNSKVHHLRQIENFMDYALPSGPVYVHLDVDVINPNDAPAMSYPAAGGPSLSVLREVLIHLARTGQIKAVSVSAWNPELDQDGKTQKVCMELIQTFIDAC
jgi:arginase